MKNNLFYVSCGVAYFRDTYKSSELQEVVTMALESAGHQPLGFHDSPLPNDDDYPLGLVCLDRVEDATFRKICMDAYQEFARETIKPQ